MRTIKFRGRYIDDSWVYGKLEDGGITQLIEEGFIDRKTIGQCIGLNDRNGCEIYEGDILRLWTNSGKEYARLLPVKYDDLWCAFVVEDKPMKEQYILWCYFLEWEVIGNIYDTPGLIYKEKE